MTLETHRPLRASERAVLERLRGGSSAAGPRFAAFLTFLVVLGVLLVALPGSWRTGVRSLAPMVVALGAAGWVFVRMRRTERRSEWRARVDQDLAGGVARVSTYRATEAIRVEEFEDEGISYWLRLEDGLVLFLSGQYLSEHEETGAFPCTRFSVVRAPACGVVFELVCEGAPLPPVATRAPFSREEYARGAVPEDGALLDVSFEALRAAAP